jgi:heptaprenylglyceryl phosphate synthase
VTRNFEFIFFGDKSMKARQVCGEDDTITIVASASITAYCLVDATGAHNAAAEAVGVALYDTDSGSAISVGVAPIEVVLSGNVCTAGGGVKTDAAGKVVNQGGSGIIVGYAIDAATGANQYIRILLIHGGTSA